MPKTFYSQYGKRIIDIVLSLMALIILSPILLLVAILIRLNLGSPVIFKQLRPGLNENIFTMYKFRTMTDEKDKKGNKLSDEERLTKFGKVLRSTSLDELPELWNILIGDMSIVGPRPQLVKDMVFMTDDQRKRHKIRPGLTGWAQVNGRNNISWQEKLSYDLEYLDKETFSFDLYIVFMTVIKVFKREDISAEGHETAMDLGDELLKQKNITKTEYDEKIMKYKKTLKSKAINR